MAPSIRRTQAAAGMFLIAVLILTPFFPQPAAAQSSQPAPASSAPATAPALTVQVAGATSVTATWTAVDGATRYVLMRHQGEWTQIGGDALTATTFTDTGLTAGQKYYYAVIAGNAAGFGPWSELVPVTVPPPDRPEPHPEEAERDVLVALYKATAGDSWTNNTNWLSGKPLAEWHGVTTDSTGSVTDLNLKSNRLSGSIPPTLGNLANLILLDLESNQLSGSVPTELGNLSNLTFLNLQRNQLSGSIPTELGKLSNLTWLGLHYNQLSGSIPTELGQLSNLQRLWLQSNRLSGAIPAELGNLSNLTGMALSENQLNGSIPTELGNLSSLTDLYLANNQLTGCIPAVWRNIQRNDLAQLGLQFCTASTPSATAPAAKPVLTVQPAGANSVTVTWTPVAGATRYDLRRHEGEWKQIGGDALAATTYTDTGLTTGRQYWYVVAAVNAAGYGPWSDAESVTVTPPDRTDAPPADTDREVLAALYNATGGANWTNNTNWLSDKPLAEWHGVTTDANGRVTKLELHQNRLNGPVPSELGNLSNLTHLFLAGNQLTGCIPAAWQNVQNNDLDQLNLPFCLHGVYSDRTVPYVIWDVGPNVPQNIFDETRTGIVLMHKYTSALGGLPAEVRPVTVFLYHDDWDALAPKYARRKGISTSDARAYLSSVQHTADVEEGFMVLFSANLAKETPAYQRWVTAHELGHNYQDWNSWYGVPYHDYHWGLVHRVLGPVWLFEGCIEFQVAKAFDAGGVIQYDQYREWTVSVAQTVSAPLKDIETRTESRKHAGSYQLGWMACELLAHISGKTVPSIYWSLPAPDTSWQDAFTQFFGLSLEEFYPRFEQHRAAGFPDLSAEAQSSSEIVNIDREYTWNVDVPQGWAKPDTEASNWEGAAGGWLEIHSFSQPAGTTLDRFAHSVKDNVQQEWLERWPSSPLFQITSFQRTAPAGQQFYHLTYRVRESEQFCILEVDELLGVGGSPPGPVQGFRLSIWKCDWENIDQDRRQILDSFRIIARPPAYYTQYLEAGGIWIKAAAKVDPRALHAAAATVDLMHARIRADFPPCLAETGAALAIIPKDEPVTTLPEFAPLKGKRDFTGRSYHSLAIRGLGAVKGQPVSATSEENLLNLPGDSHAGVDVTIHEYAHAIMNLCFSQADRDLLDTLYAGAQRAGLFPGQHAMADIYEFFAVFSTVYFNATAELSRFGLSRSQGRTDLQNQLPAVFAFMERIYNAQ